MNPLRFLQTFKRPERNRLSRESVHELNSQLSIVIARGRLMKRRVQDEVLKSELDEILEAAQRAAVTIAKLRG